MKKRSEVHLEVKLMARTMGTAGSAIWTVMLVLGFLWAGSFILRLDVEFLWAHRASAVWTSLTRESQQRTQLELPR